MIVEHREPAENDPDCEIRLGIASWAKGDFTVRSVKYTWFGRDGRAARGGEFPVEALPQLQRFAVEKGYLKPENEE